MQRVWSSLCFERSWHNYSLGLLDLFFFFWGRKQAKKRRRGPTRWLDVMHKLAFQLRKVMSCLDRWEMLCHSPSPCRHISIYFRLIYRMNFKRIPWHLDTSRYSPPVFLRPRTNLTRTEKAGSLQLPVSEFNHSQLQLPFPSSEQEE